MDMPLDNVLARLRFDVPPPPNPDSPQVLRRIAVLFTDIVSSSAYFKAHGDKAGRRLLARHERIVAAALAAQDGILVKTLGDAVMAYFPEPLQAVRAAVRIQEKTRRSNQRHGKERQMRLRIGIHCGEGIVEEKDIFGSVVNLAAKLVALAGGDEILATDALPGLRGPEAIVSVRPLSGPIAVDELKGLRIFRVLWDGEAGEIGPGGPLSSATKDAEAAPRALPGGGTSPDMHRAVRPGAEVPRQMHPACFYCGFRDHPTERCPSKRLAGPPLALRQLGYHPLEAIERSAAAKPGALPSGYGADLQIEEGKLSITQLVAIARLEILRVYQPGFLKNLWQSGDALSWDKLRAGSTAGGSGAHGGPLWLALDCLRTANRQRALALLAPFRSDPSTDPRCHGLLAMLDMENGDYPAAAINLKKALDRDQGQNTRIHLLLVSARLALMRREPLSAGSWLTEALRLLPGCPDACYLRIKEKFRTGMSGAAVNDLARLIENDREFFASVLIDPDFDPYRESIRPLLAGLHKKAREAAAAALPLADEAIKRLERLAGDNGKELGDLRAILENARRLAGRDSYCGNLDIDRLCRSIETAVKRSLAEKREQVLERLFDLTEACAALLAGAAPFSHRGAVRRIGTRILRIREEIEGVKRQLREEAAGFFKTVFDTVRNLEKETDRQSARLKWWAEYFGFEAFLWIFLKKLALFQAANLAIGLLILPVAAHYGNFLFWQDTMSGAQLWGYQKVALAGGVAAGFMLAVGGSLKEKGGK